MKIANEGMSQVSKRTIPIFDRKAFGHVYDFYRDIAPEIRRRELGVGKLPENEAKAFRDLQSIPVSYGVLDKDTSGVYHRNSDSITLRYGATPSSLAHELRHALATRIPIGKASADKVNSVFGFLNDGVDIAPGKPGYSKANAREELFTTLKEHQFRVYEELRKSLRRAPTAKEYFSHIKKTPEFMLGINHRQNFVNKYQDIADRLLGPLKLKYDSLRRYKDALMNISMNRANGSSGLTAPGVRGQMSKKADSYMSALLNPGFFRKRYDAYKDPAFEKVYSFYSDIWPEIRKRQLGVDRLPEEEQKVLDSLRWVDVSRFNDPGDRISGMTRGTLSSIPNLLKGKFGGVIVNAADPDADSTLAHEFRHWLARRINLSDDKATNQLDSIYGFKDTDKIYDWLTRKMYPWLTPEEMYTTNTEHQYRIYKNLYDKLGRKPTAADYFHSLEAVSPQDLYNNERINPVGYDADPDLMPNYLKGGNKKWETSDARQKLVGDMDKAMVPEEFTYTVGAKEPVWIDMLPPEYKKTLRNEAKGSSMTIRPRDSMERNEFRTWWKAWVDRFKDFKDAMSSVAMNSTGGNPRTAQNIA